MISAAEEDLFCYLRTTMGRDVDTNYFPSGYHESNLILFRFLVHTVLQDGWKGIKKMNEVTESPILALGKHSYLVCTQNVQSILG